MRQYISLLILSLVFTGCISLTKEVPSYTKYKLDLKDKQINTLKNISFDIIEPKTINSFNSKKIVYEKDIVNQENYALSVWSTKPSKMIQSLLLESLSTQYVLVKTPYIKSKTDFRLQSLILDFTQKVFNKTSKSVFKINLYLTNTKTKEVYSKLFYYEKDNVRIDARSNVQTLNILSNMFVKDAKKWIKIKTQDLIK